MAKQIKEQLQKAVEQAEEVSGETPMTARMKVLLAKKKNRQRRKVHHSRPAKTK